MKHVGSVTDPSYYEPFIGVEPTATYKMMFKMCEFCDEPYEIYRIKQYGRAAGMAEFTPKHRCRKKAWHDLKEDIDAGRISFPEFHKQVKEILR